MGNDKGRAPRSHSPCYATRRPRTLHGHLGGLFLAVLAERRQLGADHLRGMRRLLPQRVERLNRLGRYHLILLDGGPGGLLAKDLRLLSHRAALLDQTASRVTALFA